MMERRCTTPYIPEVQGPLDLSHFEAKQTNKPIFSPPDDMDNPADRLMMSGEHQAAGYQVKDRADLFAASESENDEFGMSSDGQKMDECWSFLEQNACSGSARASRS